MSTVVGLKLGHQVPDSQPTLWIKHVNGPDYCDELNSAAGDELFQFDPLACACLVRPDRMEDA